jgi:hypothetical protein
MISFRMFVEKKRLPNGIVIHNDDLVTPKDKGRYSRYQKKAAAEVYAHWKQLKDTKGKDYADRWLAHVSGPSTTTNPSGSFRHAEEMVNAELVKARSRAPSPAETRGRKGGDWRRSPERRELLQQASAIAGRRIARTAEATKIVDRDMKRTPRKTAPADASTANRYLTAIKNARNDERAVAAILLKVKADKSLTPYQRQKIRKAAKQTHYHRQFLATADAKSASRAGRSAS